MTVGRASTGVVVDESWRTWGGLRLRLRLRLAMTWRPVRPSGRRGSLGTMMQPVDVEGLGGRDSGPGAQTRASARLPNGVRCTCAAEACLSAD